MVGSDDPAGFLQPGILAIDAFPSKGREPGEPRVLFSLVEATGKLKIERRTVKEEITIIIKSEMC